MIPRAQFQHTLLNSGPGTSIDFRQFTAELGSAGVIDSALWYKSFTIICADFEAGLMFTSEEWRQAKIFACLDEAECARMAQNAADVRLKAGECSYLRSQ
jgi:hypothetical protein